MIFLVIIGWIVLILVLLLLVLLLNPIRYHLNARIQDLYWLRCAVHWLPFRFVFVFQDMTPSTNFYLAWHRIKITSKGKGKEKEKKIKSTRRKKSVNWRRGGIGFFKQILHFIRDILRVFKPKKLVIEGTYSFDDPANTAIASLMLNWLCHTAPNSTINLNPSFEPAATQVAASISGRVFLIVPVAIAIKYLFKREIRQVLLARNRK